MARGRAHARPFVFDYDERLGFSGPRGDRMDTDEVLKGLARESVKQGENLRSAVRELTLNALKSRELTLSEIKRVVRSVSEGVNLGATAAKLDGERVFSEALAGMDDAVLKAVQANHLALQQLSAQGQSLR